MFSRVWILTEENAENHLTCHRLWDDFNSNNLHKKQSSLFTQKYIHYKSWSILDRENLNANNRIPPSSNKKGLFERESLLLAYNKPVQEIKLDIVGPKGGLCRVFFLSLSVSYLLKSMSLNVSLGTWSILCSCLQTCFFCWLTVSQVPLTC